MEKKKLKTTEVQLRLLKIQETGFFMDSAVISTVPDFDVTKITIEFALKIEMNIESDLFGLHVVVRYKYPVGEDVKKIIELSSFNNFGVKNLKDIIELKENNEFNDKVGILPTLLSISVSSLRGILVAKTAGTILADCPLPIFNPADLCKQLIRNSKIVELNPNDI